MPKPPKQYLGNKIVGGTPRHIEVWYDLGPRIWWVQVYRYDGLSLDLEYPNGMRTTFALDTPNRDLALREAHQLAKELGSLESPLPIWLYKAKKKRLVHYRSGRR